MRIITRYILKEQIGPFLFGLALLMMIFLMNFVIQNINEIFGKGIALTILFRFIALNMAWMAAMAVPMAVLMAALMSFGRFSADNEITALKSNGISFLRVLTPLLIAAAIVMWLMVEFNNRVLPDWNHQARLLGADIRQKKPTLQVEPNIFVEDLPNFSMVVTRIERGFLPTGKSVAGSNDRLYGITIYDRSDPNLQSTVTAKEGFFEYSTEAKSLVLTLFSGEIHQFDLKTQKDYRRSNFQKNIFYIPAPEMMLAFSNSEYRGDREMSAAMMKQLVNTNRKNIRGVYERIHHFALQHQRQTVQDLVTLAKRMPQDSLRKSVDEIWTTREDSLRLFSASFQVLDKIQRTKQQLENEKYTTSLYDKDIDRYQVEIDKKYSIPFACIVFMLLGAPLGYLARRGGLAVGGAISVGFFAIYWVFLIVGEDLADRQLISPFWAMWGANFLLGLTGILLTLRVTLEQPIINFEKIKNFKLIRILKNATSRSVHI